MISGTFYTKGEVARTLGKDLTTIYRWLRSGKIRGRRVGNLVLIQEEEVRRLGVLESEDAGVCR